jgi:hypothetical protein
MAVPPVPTHPPFGYPRSASVMSPKLRAHRGILSSVSLHLLLAAVHHRPDIAGGCGIAEEGDPDECPGASAPEPGAARQAASFQVPSAPEGASRIHSQRRMHQWRAAARFR